MHTVKIKLSPETQKHAKARLARAEKRLRELDAATIRTLREAGEVRLKREKSTDT